jgi:uncharacterized protein (UPF0332 family)
MFGMKYYDAAGRSAYLAGFHAAQALISERTSRSVKTHRGVNAELHRLTKDDPRLDIELRAFLGRAYNLKAVADYETGRNPRCLPNRRPTRSRPASASSRRWLN